MDHYLQTQQRSKTDDTYFDETKVVYKRKEEPFMDFYHNNPIFRLTKGLTNTI